MLVSGLVAVLYGWAFVAGSGSVNQALLVSNGAAITASIAFIYAIVAYLWTPRKFIPASSIIGFLIIIAMIAFLIQDTGFLTSPFIALWMIAALCAPVFGSYGIAPVIGGVAIYITTLAIGGGLDFEAVALSLLLGLLPLAIGYLIWRTPNDHGTALTEDKSLNQLSDKLDSVAEQSEIVIDAIADGVIALNGRGEITLINPAAQHMLGWSRADALSLNYKSVLKLIDSHDVVPNDTNDPIYQALNTNSQTENENLRLTTADSAKTFVASLIISPLGEPGSGVIIVFRDITKARAEEREQAEFISTASHEMRTPVASIEGYLGLAINPATAQIDDKAREYITKAQDAAKHLGRLFQDLLDVSRADDGRLENKPEIIEIVPFVRDIVTGLLPTAQAKNLTLSFPPMPNLTEQPTTSVGQKTLSPVYYANVDRYHLREIVGNLIENAIKYTPSGGIIVDITNDATSLTLSIKDSGLGIPKEDIPHLFQKFYRVDSTDTREIGGTGLGLYLSRRLAESIGGKLWVESVYQEGSVFYLKIPRIDTAQAQRMLAQQKALSNTTAAAAPQVASPVVNAQPQPPQPSPQTIDPQPAPRPTQAATPAPRPAPVSQPAANIVVPTQQSTDSQK